MIIWIRIVVWHIKGVELEEEQNVQQVDLTQVDEAEVNDINVTICVFAFAFTLSPCQR